MTKMDQSRTDNSRTHRLDETIVMVPGLLSPKPVMMLMAYRFQQLGYRTFILSNRNLMKTPAENAQRLLLHIQALDTGTVHLLGHSLGGLVIMHLLRQDSELPADQRLPKGRVVLMGAPVQGSELAKMLYPKRWCRPLLRKCIQDGLLGDGPTALYGREAGTISGSVRRGVAAIFFNPAQINDGVVCQSETELDDACDAVCIPQSHALMLFSRECFDKVAAFFKLGRFN